MALTNYRLYCKKPGGCCRDYCVTVRDGKLCLSLPNNSDPCQIWQKEDGDKSTFMLINKATRKTVRYHNRGDQLSLVNKPCCLDKSVTWTANQDLTSGYGLIRTTCDPNMVMDAWTGIISDGTKLSIHPTKGGGDNQLWKLVRC